MDTAKIFALLLIIIYAMGLVRALLARERVRELVRGRNKTTARAMTVSLGAVTPFCSCSSVPLFIGFVEAGIPLAFTISVAALSLPELLILRKVIRWPALALFVTVLASAMILVGWEFNMTASAAIH